MRIRTQFILIMLLFGMILVVMAASAIITDRLVEKVGQQKETADNIFRGANELSYLATDYMIYRESQQHKRWQSKFASFSSQVASLRVDRPEQHVLVRNIQVNQKRLNEIFDSVASASGSLPRGEEAVFDQTFLQMSLSRMAVQSQGLVSDALRLSRLLHQERDHLRGIRTALMHIMVGLFGLFLVASYMLTYRRILRSLLTLQAGASIVGSGNLDFTIVEKKNDEIGDLSRAFNQMTANLKVVTASKAELEKEIEERKRTEELLREAHERAVWLARFPEQNPNPVIRSSAEGKVLYCNPASAGLHGWRCEVGQVLQSELLPLVGRAMAEGREIQEDVQLGERFYIVWIVPFPDERCVNVYGRDITQRKWMEEELRKSRDELEIRVEKRTEELKVMNEELRNIIEECRKVEIRLRESENRLRHLSTELLNAQERERRRVAQEIHDSLGASLAAAKFKVEATLGQGSHVNLQTKEALKSLVPILQGTIEEARRIQMALRPSILDDLGLLATIGWFCRQYESTYSVIRVEQEIDVEEHEISDSLKTVIFRVLQEAMNNIAKHSKANLVRLSLEKTDKRLELCVHDNGQGFCMERVDSRESAMRGLGLTSMKERTELSGGSFAIESTEGKGTLVRADWPLGKED